MEDLIKLQNFLLAIHSDPKANFLEKFDKDFKRYFFDDFSTGLLKRLTRERSRDDKVSYSLTRYSISNLHSIVLRCYRKHS